MTGFILGVSVQTLEQACRELADSCDIELRVAAQADGSCSANGCDKKAEESTLIGIRLCGEHFSAFYSNARCGLKDGTIYPMRVISGDEPVVFFGHDKP